MQISYLLVEEPPFCFGRHGVVFLFFFSGRLANRMAIAAAKVVRKIVAASLTKVCRKSIGISPPFPRLIRKRKCMPPAPSSWYRLYHILLKYKGNIGCLVIHLHTTGCCSFDFWKLNHNSLASRIGFK